MPASSGTPAATQGSAATSSGDASVPTGRKAPATASTPAAPSSAVTRHAIQIRSLTPGAEERAGAAGSSAMGEGLRRSDAVDEGVGPHNIRFRKTYAPA